MFWMPLIAAALSASQKSKQEDATKQAAAGAALSGKQPVAQQPQSSNINGVMDMLGKALPTGGKPLAEGAAENAQGAGGAMGSVDDALKAYDQKSGYGF